VFLLDDIVSELWRKENVTSGYCPRYRYTLIATLTLANLYYICVDFLPTHTIGESVLPAHFLRAFVGLFRRSFHVDRLFMWIVRDRPLVIRWIHGIIVGSFFVGIIRCASCAFVGSFFRSSLGHSLRVFVGSSLGHSLLVPLVGVVRWIISLVVSLVVGVFALFVVLFHVGCLLVDSK
jgi:hypothetical protein